METEARKLLGTLEGSDVEWHPSAVSASCNRIPTIDGHLENVWVETAGNPTPEEAEEALRNAEPIDLPSAPDPLIEVFDEPDRPQPRLDRTLGGGMTVAAGGVQATDSGLQYNCLAHNTIRGAAGASLLNGELLAEQGYL
jgi:aspartate-semialdehyde dehydrogenase